MAVFNSSNARKGVYYQYFWIKIATREEIESGRADSLTQSGDPRDNGFLYPERIGIVPIDHIMQAAGGAMPALDVNIGFQYDGDAAEARGVIIDVRSVDPGISLADAKAWIGDASPAGGASWAGKSFCVLCHTAIEPV